MLTHTDSKGRASMVDVSDKATTTRTATATATVWLGETAFRLVQHNQIQKGDVLTVAQIAGIQAAKQTHLLIPLCHQLPLSKVAVDFALHEPDFSIEITTTAKTRAQTGVEMEALTAASVAALTIYDMCKAVNKAIRMGDIQLLEKTGGKEDHRIS